MRREAKGARQTLASSRGGMVIGCVAVRAALLVALPALLLAALLAAAACSGGSGSKGGSSTPQAGGTFTANEGTAANPVLLTVGQEWVGMVSGGTSYYTFTKAAGTSVVAALTTDNTAPIGLSLQLTNQSTFAAGCPTWTAALSFTVPTTSTTTFNSSCGTGNTAANQVWYFSITETSGFRASDYSLTLTTP